MTRLRRCWALLLLAAAGVSRASNPAPPPVAARFFALFDQLRAAGEAKSHGSRRHVTFRFSDSEINDYVRYSLKAAPRPGLESMTVRFFPNNYLSTVTLIDFGAVERWHPGTIPALLRPALSGKRSISVDYRISARNSKLTFSVEKAFFEKIPLPAFFVDKLIQSVADRQPEKYDTSKPIPLPFGLKQISVSGHLVKGQN